MHVRQRPLIRYKTDHCVVILTLNNPPLNVININMLEILIEELESIKNDSCVGALVLKAEGKMFSAGVDIADHTPDKVDTMIPLFNKACQILADFPVPTIAAVQGHALGGGCELVLCCDMAYIVDGVKIGQPEIQLAAIAPIAALRLPAIIGPKAAADMLFTGRNLEAQEALDIGLVNGVVSPDDLEDCVMEKANTIANMSHLIQKINKRALKMGVDNWDELLPEMENLYLNELMKTDDAKEGLKAFVEKRSPIWQNR